MQTEWETISKDTCQWDILLCQLEDIALLNAVLNLSFEGDSKPIDFPKIHFDFQFQCLSSIQKRGVGTVSELVAKWLAQFGFEPTVFINKNDVEFQQENESQFEKVTDRGGGGVSKLTLVEQLLKVNESRKEKEKKNCILGKF